VTREGAVRVVLYALRNPLVLLSVPDREEAYRLVDEHNITARDLLDENLARARIR
jgi:hypothetical protein